MQLGVLDVLLRIRALRPDPKNMVIVAITNDDYESLFKSTSPLDASELRKLIDAISARQAEGNWSRYRHVGFPVQGTATGPSMASVVWASVPEELDKVRFTVRPVLGGAAGTQSGVALLPQEDNYVRDYPRQVVSDHGVLESFPVEIARLYRGSAEESSSLKNTWQSERLLDFWGAPDQAYRFDTYPASQCCAAHRVPHGSPRGFSPAKSCCSLECMKQAVIDIRLP